jgi:hypothetical protein
LIKKIAGVLQSGGRFLFPAPNEGGSFPPDVMTGRTSIFVAVIATGIFQAIAHTACCFVIKH